MCQVRQYYVSDVRSGCTVLRKFTCWCLIGSAVCQVSGKVVLFVKCQVRKYCFIQIIRYGIIAVVCVSCQVRQYYMLCVRCQVRQV